MASKNQGNADPKNENHENLAGLTEGHIYANTVQQIATALAILIRYCNNDFMVKTKQGGKDQVYCLNCDESDFNDLIDANI